MNLDHYRNARGTSSDSRGNAFSVGKGRFPWRGYVFGLLMIAGGFALAVALRGGA